MLEYVEALVSIHKQVRVMAKADLANADKLFARSRSGATKNSGGNAIALAAMLKAQGLCLGREYLTDDPTNRRKEPEKNNLFLDHFARYYVASM